MATRERPIDRGRVKGQRALHQFGQEFRAARRATSLSQEAIARASGISRATIGRLERGKLDDLSLMRAAELAAVVGLDLVVRTYPGSAPARDAAQLNLLQRLCSRLGPRWAWEFEVPLGLLRDQRAWDARATHEVTGMVIVVEAVTRVTDVQALLRRIGLKRRDDGDPRVILLLAETRANSLVLAGRDEFLASAFPVRTRSALRALTGGLDPGGDAMIVL
jgi:transcriptional regulator with XRE-family HTH domain